MKKKEKETENAEIDRKRRREGGYCGKLEDQEFDRHTFTVSAFQLAGLFPAAYVGRHSPGELNRLLTARYRATASLPQSAARAHEHYGCNDAL